MINEEERILGDKPKTCDGKCYFCPEIECEHHPSNNPTESDDK